MPTSFPTRARTALCTGLAMFLAGCGAALVGGSPGPAASAPSYQIGDRWVYHVVSGYGAPQIWDETHEVASVDGDGISVRVTLRGTVGEIVRTERLSSPGVIREGAIFEAETIRFDPPVVRYRFPLTAGQTWNQTVRDPGKSLGPYGPIQRQVTVGGYEKVSTPAGTFDAIRLRVYTRLDDETFWRYPTYCSYLVWYAPSVGAAVREEREASYLEKGGMDSATLPAQHAVVELTSYRRGG